MNGMHVGVKKPSSCLVSSLITSILGRRNQHSHHQRFLLDKNLGFCIRNTSSSVLFRSRKDLLPASHHHHCFSSLPIHKRTNANANASDAMEDQHDQIPPAQTQTQNQKSAINSLAQTSRSAVIRYSAGDERFQLKLTHKNKTFNFDRSTSDTLQAVVDRMIANMSKKFKSWDGDVSFLVTEEFSAITDLSRPTSSLLQDLVGGINKLSIKVSEEVYDVVVNPPEVFSIKFLKQPIVGLPILPYKIETSAKFDRDSSKYVWEYSHSDKAVAKSPADKKQKNKGNKGLDSSELIKTEAEGWIDSGCSDYVFHPTEKMTGARIRLTVFPSDGEYFGLPFSVELDEPVTPFPVTTPLYMERLQRIKKEGVADKSGLRVVSYNCLAGCYATEEWFISSPKESLPVDFRIPFLCKELAAYSADLYCLQEIEDSSFERTIMPFFEVALGYKGYMSSKAGSVKEGVAMFYNPEKLQAIKSEVIVILDHIKTMALWNKLTPSVQERVANRVSVLQVSYFTPKEHPNSVLIVANTHLYFHPDADHVRLLQTAACVDYVETVYSEMKKNLKGVEVGVLFCGDFNCTPPYSSFRYLTTGKILEDDFDLTSHATEKLEPGLNLNHNLRLTNSHPNHELTNITTCFEGCIDYILYQEEFINLKRTYPPPDKSMLASLCSLSETRLVSFPNLYTPSDHLPLIADFEFRVNERT